MAERVTRATAASRTAEQRPPVCGVVVADRRTLIAEVLADALRGAGHEILATVTCLTALCDALAAPSDTRAPDACVLDAELGVDTSTRTDEVPPEPATLVRAVRRAAPRCRIVLRADHTDARLRRAGACAVIDAREPLAALCHAVLPVRRASPARQSCPARHAEAGPLGRLSPRERVILARLATGASTACVARSLRITQQTVRAHVRSILRKLDAHSRLAALAMVEAGGELDALLAHERARQT